MGGVETDRGNIAARLRDCAGYCCERFMIPEGWDRESTPWTEMYDKYEKAKKVKEISRSKFDEDTLKTVPWLINLGRFQSDPAGKKDGRWMTHYSCKKWDSVTGKCTVYHTDRPHMCGRYPHNVTDCEYEGTVFIKEKKVEKETFNKSLQKMPSEERACDSICGCKEEEVTEISQVQSMVRESNLPHDAQDFVCRLLERRYGDRGAFTIEVRPISNGKIIRVFGKQTLSHEPLEYAITEDSGADYFTDVLRQIAMEFGHNPDLMFRG